MAPSPPFNPHAKAPARIKDTYRSFLKSQDGNGTVPVLDLKDIDMNPKLPTGLAKVGELPKEDVFRACIALDPGMSELERGQLMKSCCDRPIYEHQSLPGLLIIPSLLPPSAQSCLLDRLLHRDLSNPVHLTNLHFHHRLPYPSSSQSFFTYPKATTISLEPLDASIHKPISVQSMLSKRLRWLTLGGQYDWTAKIYPPVKPPNFPSDVAKFLEILFPSMKAQAAIVNVYSPGDILNMHRDVAEESDRGLVSISLGCDAIFVVGLAVEDKADGAYGAEDSEKMPLAIRLRSGDAVFMNGPSRFAWHGVPQINGNTCPDFLQDWPACGGGDDDKNYEHWKGWMKGKRVNLNVRQMWD